MKKSMIWSLVFGLLGTSLMFGQESNDIRNIAIKVEMPQNLSLKTDASNILFNRLNQAVALNGLGTSSGKFLLVPQVSVLSKDVTSSIPQKFIVELEVYLFIVDADRKTILQQEAITVKGIADSDEKATLKAIGNIQARHPKIKNLIVKGENKILAYYDQECDLILRKAESLIGKELYYDAIVELESIPQTSTNKECFEKSQQLLEQIDADIRSKAESQIETAEHELDWIK